VISVEQALDKVLEHIEVLSAEEAPVLGCLGQVLAEDVISEINIPPLDNSAMDGYAVRAADTKGASRKSPRILRVIDTVVAGSIPKTKVEPGTAVRIMTGAPIPKGADAIVKFEDTDQLERKDTSEVGILAEVKLGQEIRRAGEDIAKGALVLKKGTLVRPAEVGILASLGRNLIKVFRRPVVAILATGDEVVDITQSLPEGKIYNSNSYSLAALVMRYGGIPQILGIASDVEDSLINRLRLGLDADMLVTSGGVSLGDYDIVRDVLAKEGEIVFWRVRQKPGKPLAFGMINALGEGGGVNKKIPLFGLAGNPVSAMINFELFARPAMLKMMGHKKLDKPVIEAIMEEPIKNTDGRRIFARAIVEKRDGNYFARLTGPQGSGILTSMTLANGLVVVSEDKPGVKQGDSVPVIMLDWGEEV
jgi:molybdopterin molybdotransferase